MVMVQVGTVRMQALIGGSTVPALGSSTVPALGSSTVLATGLGSVGKSA